MRALEAGFNFGYSIEATSTTVHISAGQTAAGNLPEHRREYGHCLGFPCSGGGGPEGNSPCAHTPSHRHPKFLHELSARNDMGAIVFQAEDEIAAVCAAIGASFVGNLSITTTSGPGLSLKSEAMGLALISEIPLVIVDVQRAGPSTGLPTKTEQSDLNQALYGRHGDAPLVVLAASSPDDCFHLAYQAAKIAMEHMTPVILLSDTYLASGTSPVANPGPDRASAHYRTQI